MIVVPKRTFEIGMLLLGGMIVSIIAMDMYKRGN